MTEDDKIALRNWMYGGHSGDPKRSLSYIIKGLAEIAVDEASAPSMPDGPKSREHEMNQRQWARAIPRLRELAEWIKEFGPGSGCR
jgi:hypothetical protein